MTATRLFFIQTLLTISAVIFFHSSIVRIDSNVHEQYFVDKFTLASICFIIYCFLFSVVYYFLGRRTNNKLGLLHFILGLPIYVLTFAEQFGLYQHDPIPRRYFTNNTSKILDVFPVYSSFIHQLTLSLMVLGLAVFIINLVFKKT